MKKGIGIRARLAILFAATMGFDSQRESSLKIAELKYKPQIDNLIANKKAMGSSRNRIKSKKVYKTFVASGRKKWINKKR